MKKNRSHIGDQSKRMSIAMIAGGILVGIIGGLMSLLYRIALNYAEKWLDWVLLFIKGNPFRIAGWFLVLMLFAVFVGRLIKWEPMAAGGGIPQVKREVNGNLLRHWKRVLPAKFTGGFLCILGGLSLGRCGPSIQLGAMAGQGVSRIFGRDEDVERRLMTCGAGAGMAATFHTPLAGMIFAMEAINKRGNMPLFITVLAASVAADFCSSFIIGSDPICYVDVQYILPQTQYWLLLLLGLLLGIGGVFYSRAMLKAQRMYKKMRFLDESGRMMTAFFISGVFGLLMPSVLGGGNRLVQPLTNGEMLLGSAVLALVMKFLFTGICFGAGAPGGSVYPILSIGALAGAVFAMGGVELIGLDPVYINNFVLLAMAGFFSAAMRAPVTGIILLFEMSGSVSQLLSLSIVCLTAYVVVEFMDPDLADSIPPEKTKALDEGDTIVSGKKQ